MPKLPDLVFDRFVGQSTDDPIFEIEPGHCRAAVNIDLHNSSLGKKRAGAVDVPFTGVSPDENFRYIAAFYPDEDVGNIELFVFDDSPAAGSPLVARLAAGSTWASVTVDDALQTTNDYGKLMSAAQLDGKLFVGYASNNINRLHVWDPADSKIRRCGLATPAAPSVADTGSGSYAATIRYYKVAYTVQSSGVTIRRSELSDAQSFTPSGSGTAARVTKPAAISEGETHWELYASADDLVYRLIATTVVGTTTYDDSADPAAYEGDFAPSVGMNIPPPAAKFLLSDGQRLLMAGTWASVTAQGDSWALSDRAVWYTPVISESGVGDSERVPNISGEVENRISISEPVIGLGGPLDGDPYVFSVSSVWRFVRTGIAASPYIPYQVAKVGCVSHRAIVMGVDEGGRQALYFMAPDGPRRIVEGRVQDLSHDMKNTWRDDFVSSQLVAPATLLFNHGKNQLLCWYYDSTESGGGAGSPDINALVVFHADLGVTDANGRVRGGWTRWQGASAGNVESAVMFPSTLANPMSGKFKPYALLGGLDARLVRMETGTQDINPATGAAASYQGYMDLPYMAPWGLGRTGQLIEEPYVYSDVQAGASLQLTIDRDFGLETVTGTATLSASGSETHLRAKFEGIAMADAEVLTFRIGDAGATSATWDLAALVFPLSAAGRDGVGD